MDRLIIQRSYTDIRTLCPQDPLTLVLSRLSRERILPPTLPVSERDQNHVPNSFVSQVVGTFSGSIVLHSLPL